VPSLFGYDFGCMLGERLDICAMTKSLWIRVSEKIFSLSSLEDFSREDCPIIDFIETAE
jgi:hypothetical protein